MYVHVVVSQSMTKYLKMCQVGTYLGFIVFTEDTTDCCICVDRLNNFIKKNNLMSAAVYNGNQIASQFLLQPILQKYKVN